MKNIKLYLNVEPKIEARAVYPQDTKIERKSKCKKQFVSCNTSILTVFFNNEEFTITAFKNYCFDGATIPFGIGKGNMKLLVPALFHDIMCENKSLVNNNRKLSSVIFKKLLLMCGVSKLKAQIMYLIVDNFQKLKRW